jgi:mannose-6-phosphate isomerase-like protein (cupin superfamily)
MTDDTILDPAFRQRLQLSRDGDVLHVKIWTDPGGGVPAHYHPTIEERWHVLEGELSFRVGRRKVHAGPGDVVIAAPGVRHSFTNTGSDVAVVNVEVEPASRMQQFLEEAAALSRAGKYNRRGIPTGLSGLIAGADLAQRYRDVTVLTSFPLPPPALQPIVFGPLARRA